MPREPLSHAQIELIASETRHASEKALERYSRSSLAGFLVLLIGIGMVFGVTRSDATSQRKAIVHSGQAVAVEGCNRDFKTITRVRSLLRSARDLSDQAAAHGEITPRQLKVSDQFYSTQLRGLPLPDCRLAKAILTDDPNKPVAVPQPLHP